MHLLSKKKRVSVSRLTGLIKGMAAIIEAFAAEWCQVHTDEVARAGSVRKIVEAWFLHSSKVSE